MSTEADTTLIESWEERKVDGFVRISLGGDAHCRAIINAVADHYNELTGRPRPTLTDLEARVGEKVTLIYTGENMLGAGLLKAREGTLFSSTPGTVAMLPKRARRNGWRIDPRLVLDLFPGYDTAAAQEQTAKVRAHYPELTEITTERLCELPEWDEDESQPITLCAFGTWRMPDGAATDAIQLIATYDREADVCDGGVLLIRPEHGTSEHGSCYGRQIKNDFGEVRGFEPISFKEAIELCQIDFDEAYERVIGSAMRNATVF